MTPPAQPPPVRKPRPIEIATHPVGYMLYDQATVSHRIEYRRTETNADGDEVKKYWVVERIMFEGYARSVEVAVRLATMYRFVRIVRIEHREQETIQWNTQEEL